MLRYVKELKLIIRKSNFNMNQFQIRVGGSSFGSSSYFGRSQRRTHVVGSGGSSRLHHGHGHGSNGCKEEIVLVDVVVHYCETVLK